MHLLGFAVYLWVGMHRKPTKTVRASRRCATAGSPLSTAPLAHSCGGARGSDKRPAPRAVHSVGTGASTGGRSIHGR